MTLPVLIDLTRPPARRGLGAMMVGGSAGKRRRHDHYDTPWPVTEALYRAEYSAFARHGHVWDPACGSGAILDALEAHGVGVIGSDLIDRGVGLPGSLDFLRAPALLSPMIVTNPPFRLAQAFIRKALSFAPLYLALLLKATYFHAKSRIALFEEMPPARIHPLSWRPDFSDEGSPTMDCAWFVWEGGAKGPCVYGRPLARPAEVCPWHLLSAVSEEAAP